MKAIFTIISLFLIGAFSANSQIVGPYVGIDYATDYTNPSAGAACAGIGLVNAAIGDADFVNGAAEVPLGWSFSGTWNSGATYYDEPGSDLLLVSLHTYTESWQVALRISDGSTTAFLPYNLTIVTSNAVGTLAACGGIYPGPFNYERPSQEVDFASYVIPPGEGVIGIVFEPFADGAVNPDPHGVIVIQEVTCDSLDMGAYDPELCFGDELTLDATSINGGAITWDGGVTDGVAFVPPLGVTTYTATSDFDGDCEFVLDITVNPTPIVDIVDPGTICEESFDLTTLVVTDADGVAFPVLEFYTDYPDSVDQVVGVWPGDLLFEDDTVYVMIGDMVSGCYDAIPFWIEFADAANAGPDNADDLCSSVGTMLDLNTLLTGADLGGTWTELTGSGAFDPVTGEFVSDGLPPGDYVFRYEVSAAPCADDEADIIVTVLTDPIIDAGPDQIMCLEDIVTVSGSGGVSYVWDGGVLDGLPFSPAATTTYTVTGTDASGCFSTDELEIIVNDLPIVSAGDDLILCEGINAVLSGSGAIGYEWTDPVLDGVAFTPPIGTTTYVVTGTDANGCENSDEVEITVNELPNVTAPDDFIVCAGTAITLSAVGAPTIVWDGGVINGESFIPLVTTVYTVYGTDEFGCENSDEVTVTVEPIPNLVFQGDILAGCAPLEVTFTNLTVAPGTECKWIIEGNVIDGCAAITYVFNSPGCFDVTFGMTSATGCYTEKTYSDYICLDETPEASFYSTPSVLDGANPLAQFHNTSTGATTYEWDFGDGTAGSTALNPEHLFPPDKGEYIVELTAFSANGCADQAYLTIRVLEDIIFYVPNIFTPDGDNFNETFKPIFTSGFDPYDYHLLIFNRWGEIVFESFNAAHGWDGTYGDNEICEDGVYIWSLEFGDINDDKKHKKSGHVSLLK
ncbi:MAG: T9SS type B sorting domain-containing protein [Crocinitomix sp.]|nr:T9SS type B sorting domain-containing protein [Crocinitomix sp.]